MRAPRRSAPEFLPLAARRKGDPRYQLRRLGRIRRSRWESAEPPACRPRTATRRLTARPPPRPSTVSDRARRPLAELEQREPTRPSPAARALPVRRRSSWAGKGLRARGNPAASVAAERNRKQTGRLANPTSVPTLRSESFPNGKTKPRCRPFQRTNRSGTARERQHIARVGGAASTIASRRICGYSGLQPRACGNRLRYRHTGHTTWASGCPGEPRSHHNVETDGAKAYPNPASAAPYRRRRRRVRRVGQCRENTPTKKKTRSAQLHPPQTISVLDGGVPQATAGSLRLCNAAGILRKRTRSVLGLRRSNHFEAQPGELQERGGDVAERTC
ncbi:MAG: hypothetical protein D6725_04385 [Planctomycetota bacterium]|nr:MAG: hypothetical protein D6725_04385 [Planctomycetota bacterium]